MYIPKELKERFSHSNFSREEWEGMRPLANDRRSIVIKDSRV